MAKLVPPQLVRSLMSSGCMGEFDAGASAFNPDESAALVRWLARLLAVRTVEAGDAFVDTLAAVLEAGTRRHRVADPLACHKGCGSCCHQQVSVPAPEIFAVARRLRRSKALAAAQARLAAWPGRRVVDPARVLDPPRVLDPARPCVFLVDEACGIHLFRPMVCRAIVSLSKPACLRRLAAGNGNIPFPRSHEAIRQWIETAVWTAHSAAGLEPRGYDLEAGVAAVLADPGIEARWYAGEAALAAAADPPLPPQTASEITRLRQMARL